MKRGELAEGSSGDATVDKEHDGGSDLGDGESGFEDWSLD